MVSGVVKLDNICICLKDLSVITAENKIDKDKYPINFYIKVDNKLEKFVMFLNNREEQDKLFNKAIKALEEFHMLYE